jgi:hypothetical protein
MIVPTEAEKGSMMSKKTETETAPSTTPADQKAPWESPALRHAGHVGDILLQTAKGGLSEHDPGILTYKPHGQDPH